MSSLFSELEVNTIRAIPLSFHSSANLLTWHYEKDGRFMMRNAYHLARKWLYLSSLRSSSSSNPNRESIFWAKVWCANVPPKVKVCMWRLCNNIIPTKVNLTKSHIMTDLLCMMCNHPEESILHLLKDCPFTKCTWLSSYFGYLLQGSSPQSFLFWAMEITELIKPALFESFVMICWVGHQE